MIAKMSSIYNSVLTDFLYKYGKLKQYYVAWIPENYNEITSLDKSSFILCIEEDKIVGCLGAYTSHEQKLVRLLGPVIDEKYFNKYIKELYTSFLDNLSQDINELKIAFFKENSLCKKWCQEEGFHLYNAEKTMIFDKAYYPFEKSSSSAILKFYEPEYFKAMKLVHPKETFFTLEELISEISEYHHLLLAVVSGEVLGYVYYEQAEDKKQGEISLLHVRSDSRDKGYGTLLLKSALENLISDDIEEITISVRTTNYGAERLYIRIGFVDKETIYAYEKQLK